ARQRAHQRTGRIDRRARKRAEAGDEDGGHTPNNAAISSTAKVGVNFPAATCASATLSLLRTAGSERSRAVSRSSSMVHIHLTCCSRRRSVSSPLAVILSLCASTCAQSCGMLSPVSAEYVITGGDQLAERGARMLSAPR